MTTEAAAPLCLPLVPSCGGGTPPDPLIGGKAAGLMRLIEAGFTTPDGFVVTTESFRLWLGGDGSRPQAIDALDRAATAAEAADAMHAALGDRGAPTAVRAWIARFLDQLAPSGRTATAVRSSAAGEDGARLSYAGVYRSRLGVVGGAAVLDAVREVWLSAFSAAAIAYRRRFAPEGGLPAMAVVVQRMLTPRWAGVLFTCDPASGARDQFVIECTQGLGEDVVAGRLAVTQLRIPRGGEATPAPASGRGGGGGFSDDPACARLVEAARAIETLWGGGSIEIEWAVQDDKLYLLQARPVTTGPAVERAS